MSRVVFAVASLFLVGVALCQPVVHECHHRATWGPSNAWPISNFSTSSRLVKTVARGKLFEARLPAAANQTFFVMHVYGTPFEWGVAHAELLGAKGKEFISRTWAYLEQQVAHAVDNYLPPWLADLVAVVGLDAALDLTADATEPWTDEWFYEELHGLAHASGIDYAMIRRVHMLAGLTQGKCSLYGAWGAATADGHTLQLRALDWNMDGPFRDFPLVTVYHPSDAKMQATATVGMIGFIGGLTGINAAQMAISEIGVTYPDASFGDESRFGVPFIVILKDILLFDRNLTQSVDRLKNARRTCDLILGVGDGKTAKRVDAFQYSYSTLDVITDTNLRPKNKTWHFEIPDTVYFGMDWLCPGYTQVLGTQLRKYHGKLTNEIAARNVVAVEMSGTNHIAIYDLTTQEMLVSFAAPSDQNKHPNAYERPYMRFDVAKLFQTQL